MKIEWKKLVPCLILPLAVGGIAAFLTRDGMRLFETVEKPPLSPPGWLFPVAWTILYLMMEPHPIWCWSLKSPAVPP